MHAIRVVGVIGAGTMGNGIAHAFACSGYEVLLCEVEQRFLDRGLETLRNNLEREAAKGRIPEEAASVAFVRVTGVLDRERLAECDFVVEAATEKFEVKKAIFADLDRLTRKEVILASNTSSIAITKLASVTGRPDRVIGMHFFNPVSTMKLVEEVRSKATSQET